jgi:GT2 family glycosyltransferase
VIPTWTGVELLRKFFPSVAAAARQYVESSGRQVEIVLVDDGSADGTGECFHDLEEDSGVAMRLLVNPTNQGFGATVNRGVREARFPYVLLLNNDVEIMANAIAPLAGNFSNPEVFAAHARVFEYGSRSECGSGQLGSFRRGSIRVHQQYRLLDEGHGAHPASLYSMFASGGSSMIDREKFLAAGGFDELLSPAYWEDVEISYRAWKRGWTVVYEPRAVVYHQVSSTMRRLNPRRVRRVQMRNRLIFHWIHLHETRYWVPHVLWAGLLWVTAPLRLQPLYMLAVLDAVRRLPRILQRREQEKAMAKRRDHEVFEIFQRMRQRKDLSI